MNAPVFVLTPLVVLGVACGEVRRGDDALPRNHLLMEKGEPTPFSEEASAAFLHATDFAFTWTHSAGVVRTLSISISGTGDAEVKTIALDNQGRWVEDPAGLVVHDERVLRLSEAQVAELRRLVASREFQTMPRPFLSNGTDDLFVYCAVTAGGFCKEVHCDGYFPKPIRQIAAHLQSAVASRPSGGTGGFVNRREALVGRPTGCLCVERGGGSTNRS